MNNPLPSSTFLTLGQAAKLADVAKSTITRAIEKGALTASSKVGNSYRIDPAELQRWQGSRVNPNAGATVASQPSNTEKKPHATSNDTIAVHVRNAQLEAELDALKQQHEQMQANQSELKALTEKMLADKDREIERLYTLAITDQRRKGGMLGRLFGGKKRADVGP